MLYREMISIKNAVEQMVWADNKLFDCLKGLPREAREAQSAPDDWNVARLTFHLIASAD
jgi:uncharacterized damage-inducible protein DinB